MKMMSGILCLLILLTGCNGNSLNKGSDYPKIEIEGSEKLPMKEDIKIPAAPGLLVVGDTKVEVDYSNTKTGYIMAKTLIDKHSKIKIQIKKDGETYNYDLAKDYTEVAYPLNMGDGVYTIQVRENVGENNYALLFSQDIEVSLENQFDPFLYPSIIIDYDLKTKAIDHSFDLCKSLTTEIERVHAVYTWITTNIEYDWEKVEEVQNKFVLPEIDETLETKTGICFDYAALMTCMLRVQQIPTKLVTGYVEEGYHAWVEVYINDVGWIDPDTYFGSNEWQRLDPTFNSSGQNYSGSYEDKYKY